MTIKTQIDFDDRTEACLRQLRESGEIGRLARDHEPGEILLVVMLSRRGDVVSRVMPWALASGIPGAATSDFYRRLLGFHDAGALPVLLSCPELDMVRTAAFAWPTLSSVPAREDSN